MTTLRDANIFQDFTVWINDIGKIGVSPGFQPPEIKLQTEDFRGGGMDGTVEVPMGVEKIEFDFDLHTWDLDVWTYLGFGTSQITTGGILVPNTLSVPVTFRGYLITPAGGEKGVRIDTSSLIKEIKVGKVEPGKKVEATVSCVASKYKQVVDDKTIVHIDVFDKVFVVNGQDRSENARNILGFAY